MSTARPISLRPGYLVALTTRLEGGVEYTREELDHQRIGPQEEGEQVRWQTEKRITDVEEMAEAVRVRGRVRDRVKSACIWTPFGLICPADQIEALDARIAECHAMVATFNATAVHTRVRFPEPLRGRIAEDTRQAVAAVREEIQTLVGEMQAAMASARVESIRDVAQRATQMGRLLEQGTEARTVLERAVKESRRLATELVKRVEDGADAIAEVLAGTKAKVFEEAAFAFSEDEMGEITDDGPELPSAAVGFGGTGEEYVPEEQPAVPVDPPAAPQEAPEVDPFAEEEIVR